MKKVSRLLKDFVKEVKIREGNGASIMSSEYAICDKIKEYLDDVKKFNKIDKNLEDDLETLVKDLKARKETEPQCVNCGSIEDGRMVINSCGHAEYICDDCCRVLDTIYYDFDKDTWYCEDKCLKCYN